MAYNETTANRIREAFEDLPDVAEKVMFGGICFMVDDKMCICVNAHELMCRVGAQQVQSFVDTPGCREVVMKGGAMKDYIYVDIESVKSKKTFDQWVAMALEFNKHAKASPKKKKKQ